MQPATAKKHAALQAHLRDLESVLVAFSGGVDSALLLKTAVQTLGRDRALAVTARSPSLPRAELQSVAALAAEVGAAHEFVETREFEDENYISNPPDRCYYCKRELCTRLTKLATQRGLKAVIGGANVSDLDDYRPGLKAADEHGVCSPLIECGITKADVREMAAALELSVHDKPAAPCLATRVPYGERITPEKLRRIDDAETFLRERGFRECRVRHHENLARIEVPASEMDRFSDPEFRAKVYAALRELGYHYVALDLRGFRSGSMNEPLLEDGPAG
jgi:uncharacterized protein